MKHRKYAKFPKHLNCTISNEMFDKLESDANLQKTTVSEIVRLALELYYDGNNRKTHT